MLTRRQLVHWQTFGFVVLRGLLTADEAATARREFEAGLGAHRPEYASPTYFSALGPLTPFLASLSEDPRFLEAGQQMWGEDAVAIGSSGQIFTKPYTYWHPDIPEGTPETKDDHVHGVKFAFYLDPLEGDTGALRLIPGSHKSPYHDRLFAMGLKGEDSPYLKKSNLSVRDIPAYIWEAEPTDVLAFNLRVWHGGWGGSADRRQCAVVYYENPSTPRQEELAREMARWQRKVAKSPAETRYDPQWLSNPERSPTRQRWIEYLRRYGFLDPDRQELDAAQEKEGQMN